MQWVVNAYLLPLSALLLLGGALGDHFGRRRLLVFGTGLFAAASLVCALAPALPLLLAARAVQGIGAALLLPNSLALLNAAFSGEKRGRAVGIWAAAGAATAAAAPLLGGWLVDTVGWPAIFYINLPLAIGAIVLALTFVRESREGGAGRTDYAGALLVTAGLGGLTYALTLWSASSRFSTIAAASLFGGVVLIGCIPGGRATAGKPRHAAARPVRKPLLLRAQSPHLPALRGIRRSDAVAALCADQRRRLFAGRAGLAMLPLPVLMTALSPLMGSLAARIGPRGPLIAGPVIAGGGMMLARLITPDGSYWTGPFPSILVMAAGMTIAVAPLTASVLGSVEERHVAMASGLNSAVARLGGLIATALLGSVLGLKGDALFGGFHTAMFVSAAVAVLAGVVAVAMLGQVAIKRSPTP